MEFNTLELLVSIAGGVFGAVIGAFPAWILCGLAVLIGATMSFVNGDPRFMSMVAWGHFFGPQTSFVGGCAAAAYAAKLKLIGSGREISTSLIGLQNPKVLLMGGLFGGIGYLLFWGLMQVPNYSDIAWTNIIALAVILGMVIIRLTLGTTGLFGHVAEGEKRWVPTESASWINYQSRPQELAILAFTIGTPAAYFTQVLPNSGGLVFGFVTFMQIFMLFGHKVPVAHHIALSSSMIAAATGSVEWGVCFAFLAAYLGESAACIFLYRGDTHIDPPTAALVVTGTLFPIFDLLNIFDLSPTLSYLVMAIIVVGGYMAISRFKTLNCKCE